MGGLFVEIYYGEVNFGYQNDTFEDAMVNYGKSVMAHFADRVPIVCGSSMLSTRSKRFELLISGMKVDYVQRATSWQHQRAECRPHH